MSARKASKPQQFKHRCALENWATNLAKRVEGKAKPVPRPKTISSDLLAVYPMGDPHFGMYAWKDEAGEDFDLKIAERITRAAIDSLVADAPSAKQALILELGDFFHADDPKNQTPGSGHILDVDSRHDRVREIGFNAMVYVIEATLRKHERVTVRINPGNHDPVSSGALRLALWAYFRNEPRVTIDRSPADRFYYRFGNVLAMSWHSDKCKPKQIGQAMASERAKDWGDTCFRYAYGGHVHHDYEEELGGVKVQQFRTLAPKDAWHAGMGYVAGRDMKCIVMHRKLGERYRITWPIQMMGYQRNSGASHISTSRKGRPVTKQGARSR